MNLKLWSRRRISNEPIVQKVIIGNSSEHFLSKEFKHFPGKHFWPIGEKYTGFKILSNISEMLWRLANKNKKKKNTNNPSNLFKLNMVHDSSRTG